MNRALAQGVLELAAATAGFAALLIVGAEALDWRWIAGLFAGTLAVGSVRAFRGLPESYALLQLADRRLGLRDTLSSAYYFHASDGLRPVSEAMREALLGQAERLAREVDLRRAVPLVAPRSLYALAALAALSGGLFAVRYGASRRLDLRPPLASVLFPGGWHRPRQFAESRKDGWRERFQHTLRQMGLPLEPEAPRRESRGQSLPAETPSAAEAAALRPPELSRPVPLSAGEELSGEDGAWDPGAQSSDAAAGEGENPAASARQPAEAPGENSNLLEQFREALASLLSRLKSRPGGGNSPLAADRGRQGNEAARSRRQASEKGESGPGRRTPEEATESDGDLQAPSAEQARGASGKPGGRDADLQPAREGRSGIGKEDGLKQAREAEQLAAMGKISELFGRRQATLTGEVTIEVASGDQKLRTPYSEQQARHAEAGGEIHRDEVPLLYHDYIRRYFEQIRRSPASPGEEKAARAAP